MRPSQIGMVFVLMPPSVKARVRVSVVDPEPIVRILSIPLDGQFQRIGACRGIKASWVEGRSQLLGLDMSGTYSTAAICGTRSRTSRFSWA